MNTQQESSAKSLLHSCIKLNPKQFGPHTVGSLPRKSLAMTICWRLVMLCSCLSELGSVRDSRTKGVIPTADKLLIESLEAVLRPPPPAGLRVSLAHAAGIRCGQQPSVAGPEPPIQHFTVSYV